MTQHKTKTSFFLRAEKTPVSLYRQAGTRWLLCPLAGSHRPERLLLRQTRSVQVAAFLAVICGLELCRKSRSVQFWHRQSCPGGVWSGAATSLDCSPPLFRSFAAPRLCAAEKGNLPERCQGLA